MTVHHTKTHYTSPHVHELSYVVARQIHGWPYPYPYFEANVIGNAIYPHAVQVSGRECGNKSASGWVSVDAGQRVGG